MARLTKTLIDRGGYEGQPYLGMERLVGQDLHLRLSGGALPLEEVAKLVAKRDAWIKDNRERAAGSEADSFDSQVLEMLSEQTKKIGLDYGDE